MIRVAITGACGRMGQALAQAAEQQEAARLTAALERPGSPHLGMDLGEIAGTPRRGVIVGADLPAVADTFDVLIDFSRPEATLGFLSQCLQHRKAMVIGTTGLDAAQTQQIAEAAQHLPIVYAPNMSVGVNLLLRLVELAAGIMGHSSDIEVIEAHHRHKIDAPSGTALRLGEAAAAALGKTLCECAVYARQGITGERPPGSIGFAIIRAGDIVGEHTVMLASAGERLELTHKATSRLTFAGGALRAAAWLADRPAGLYDMQDVLGLKQG